MPTRRELLLSLIASPAAAALVNPVSAFSGEPEIWAETHYLSQESARGFRLLLNERTPPNTIILSGARELSAQRCRQVLCRARAGAWVVCESGLCFSSREDSLRQAHVWNAMFGLRVLPPVRVGDGHPYVAYNWPVRRLVRSFHAITPIRCGSRDVIAEFGGVPVCAKQSIGRGGVVYLGSMLGPGLYAEEPEAHALGSAMLRTFERSDL